MVCVLRRRDNPQALVSGLLTVQCVHVCTGRQTMLYLTCTMISSIDLAYNNGVSHAEDLGNCGLWYDV